MHPIQVEGIATSAYHPAKVKISSRTLFRLTVAFAALLCARGYALPDVHAVAQAVDAHYNHLHSLEADFVEIYQGSGMARSESGTLWLKKPGKMRCEYRSPEEKLFVTDGDQAWLYLPGEKQARKSSLRKMDDLRSPLAFLLGKTKLEKELLNLSFAPEVQPSTPENAVLRGMARGLGDRIRQVLIEVTPEHRIARILIDSTDDSITEYRFNNQRENVQVLDSKFRFRPPAGSEVIEDEAD